MWPLLYFWQATLRQAVFDYGDIFLFFYPTHLAYANALHALRLPLWEPNMLAGFPLFAEGQIGALYPTHPLLYGLLPIDVATNFDILLHVSWVAMGTYLVARSFKFQPASAFLSAFTFALGGFFFARLQHMSVLATAAWLPWLLWAWEHHEQEVEARKRLRWFALIAVMGGIQLLGGHPQFAFSSALLLGLHACIRWPREGAPRLGDWLDRITAFFRNKLGKIRVAQWFFEYFDPLRVVPLATALIIGAGIAAVQLMPTFELASFTNRAGGLEARFFNAFSLRIIHYIMLFNPFVLGNPWPHVSVEVIGYVGLLTVVFAICAILVRRDRRVVFFLFIALAALFLGLGDLNIFYRGLRHLPLFNYFRVPSRFLYWYTFAAAMLGGITFDYLLQRAKTTVQLTRAQKIVLAVFTVLVASIVGLVPFIPVEVWLQIWSWLPLALAGFIAWIILGARRGLFARPMLIALVLGLTVVDLSLFGAVYAKTYDSTTTVDDFYRPPDSLSVLKGLTPGNGRVWTSLWIIPWQNVERESLYPNIGMIYGIPNGIGYTPLLPQLTSDYIDQLNAPLLNLMNVRYYIIPQMLPISPGVEGEDVHNKFALDPVGRDLAIPPTSATKLRVVSSLAQSVDWNTGKVVANIYLTTADGALITVPLRVGENTAEWAYERSDVRRVLRYPMPVVATSFPAISAFPLEKHVGHAFMAEFDLSAIKPAPVITGVFVYPEVEAGLVHVDQMTLVGPDGKDISIAHLVGRDEQTLVYRSNYVAIYENHDPLPRAFLVHAARVVADTTAADEMYRADFKPSDEILLTGGEPLQGSGAQRADESAHIVEYKPERVVLQVHASAEGYVFLGDSWFPGWVARVDGVETPIQRANMIFRAVRVTPGDHRIEMEYHPQSLVTGGIVSLLSLLVVVGIVLYSRRT